MVQPTPDQVEELPHHRVEESRPESPESYEKGSDGNLSSSANSEKAADSILASAEAAAKPELTASQAASIAARDETLAPFAPERRRLNDFFLPKSRRRVQDLDATATQASVFDDPVLSKHYWPPTTWENYKNWDVNLRWTFREEQKLVRILDRKVLVWVCIFFAVLNLDRGNLSAANTDGFLKDLKLTTNDYNLATTLFRVMFLVAELPGQIISKRVGPDVFVPCQMVAWGIVTLAQRWTTNRASFLALRSLLGLCQGSMIPDLLLLLSYFYTTYELGLRLCFFWVSMNLTNFLSSYSSYGLISLRGHLGWTGWQFLFFVEGLFTIALGILAFFVMPASPSQTKRVWSKKPFLNERRTKIAVARVLRDEPQKSSMHNREGLSPYMVWRTIKNWRLWPIYVLGVTFGIPVGPVSQYLTLSLRNLGFSTLLTQTLSSVQYLIAIFTGLGVVILSELLNERSLVSAIEDLWALPFLIAIYVLGASASSWTYFALATILLGAPYVHPIQTGWVSANAGDVQTRTVAASLYNIAVQLGSIISSQIYRASDAPQYRIGNRVLIAICCVNLALYVSTKFFYITLNKRRERIWNGLSAEEKSHYLATTRDEGNERLDFRFVH